MTGIQKILEPIRTLGRIQSFTTIGDPGCDGLGAEIMSTFARALTARKADFSVILGDLVPFGSPHFYRHIVEFVDQVAINPVYSICGNHDTKHYAEYFGLRNHAVVAENALCIFLDGAARILEEATLAFLADVLAKHARPNVFVFLHIPPPNSMTENTLNPESWGKVCAILAPHRERIAYIVSAHLHSFFEDRADGYPLLVTGGGGARLEALKNRPLEPRDHHILLFSCNDQGRFTYERVPLDGLTYTREVDDKVTREHLQQALQNECLAHVSYRIFAEDAAERGMTEVAHLFRAASDAEFYHARNHFAVLNRLRTPSEYITQSLAAEEAEVSDMYRSFLDDAKTRGMGLASYAFHDAREAEKVHRRLFSEAAEKLQAACKTKAEGNPGEAAAPSATPASRYFTCTSCGQTFHGDNPPQNCPICGAPHDKIHEV